MRSQPSLLRLAMLTGWLWLAGPALATDGADWVNDPDLEGIVDLLDPDYRQQPINIARLPLKYAITHVYGKGERVIYTFEDPNCGYCRQLHRQVAAIGNLTVHTFVLTFLGPDSGTKASAAWCSADKAAAWNRIMRQETTPSAPAGCVAPSAQTMKLAAMLGINLIPTVFFADGSRMNGVKPPAEIDDRIRQAAREQRAR